MLTTTDFRLPGVYFLPPPRPTGPGFPPLDVAAFVGFAERGPLHLPVAVEDVNIFHAVFGEALPLARDPGGQTVYANLPQSVASFFTNGGRRCYVVRVAGDEAKPTRFRIPGLVAVNDTGHTELGSLTASSAGRWAARLRLATRLQVTPLPVAAFNIQAEHTLTWETGSAPDAIGRGDLLRLTFMDGQQLLFPVAAVQRSPEAFRQVTLMAPHTWQLATTLSTSMPVVVEQIQRLTLDGLDDLASNGLLSADEGLIRLDMFMSTSDQIQPGDHLVLRLSDDGSSHLFPILRQRSPDHGNSPPEPVSVFFAAEMMALTPVALPNGALRRVERLRFDLVLREEEVQRSTISGLAFNTGHRRFWGEVSLLESSPLYQQSRVESDLLPSLLSQLQPGGSEPGQTALTPAAQAARLFRELQQGKRPEETQGRLDVVALAGLLAPLAEEPTLTYLPLGMPAIVTEGEFIAPAKNHWGDDDLAKFKPDLFVDPYLLPDPLHQASGESARTLQMAAFDRYYMQGKRLQGLHSLFFIDEIALISLPDLVHRPWEPAQPESPSEPAPPLPAPPSPLPCPPPGRPFVSCPEEVESDQEGGELEANDGHPFMMATPPDLPVVQPEDASLVNRLVAIQRAVINFCQARQDVVAILTLPRHFEKRDCIDWHETLRQYLGLPRPGTVVDEVRDLADLSYAAVYHPWLLVAAAGDSDQPQAMPCDGAVCGLIAARERQRQVWVAPANMALQDAPGLTPVFSTGDWADLFERQFNLIRPEPRDFRVMSAHTLSDERSLLQLSVRRLMILLRKLAVERGMDFVFESNHERFREGVRVILEDLLLFMYDRGAFAGASAGQAFRVITDASLNTPQSIDQGRFIAQIQVAPSQPLEFITVQLIRTGEGLLLTTEV